MGDDQEYQKLRHEYRSLLIEGERKAQEDYDKTIITLSGGALGVSMVFIKDVLGSSIVDINNLQWAWGCWAASLLCVLFSFFLSQQAFRKAIFQVDDRKELKSPGGIFSTLIQIANPLGGVLFLLGVVFIIIFAGSNLR